MQSGQSLCRNTSLPEGFQHAHPNAAKFIVSRTTEFSPICQSYQSHECIETSWSPEVDSFVPGFPAGENAAEA